MAESGFNKTVSLDRTVVSVVHCGCTNLGLLPSLDKCYLLHRARPYSLKVLRDPSMFSSSFRFSCLPWVGARGVWPHMTWMFIWTTPSVRSDCPLSNGPLFEKKIK